MSNKQSETINLDLEISSILWRDFYEYTVKMGEPATYAIETAIRNWIDYARLALYKRKIEAEQNNQGM